MSLQVPITILIIKSEELSKVDTNTSELLSKLGSLGL
jgi:hypothetical protein